MPAGDQMVSVSPTRLLDTRTGRGTPATAGSTIELTVTGGTNNIPTDATAVALNLTATDPTSNGFITIWPCGTPRPNASNLNIATGTTTANLVIAKTGANGTICIYTQPTTHLIADLNAFWGNIAPSARPVVVDAPAPTAMNGQWYVVSLVDQGGWIADRNGRVCNDRDVCSWYMVNSWGPEFRQGWIDSLWQYAVSA
jgi:hypothetical protein